MYSRRKNNFSTYIFIAIIIKHKAAKRTIAPINNREKVDQILSILLAPERAFVDYFEISHMKSFNFHEFYSDF